MERKTFFFALPALLAIIVLGTVQSAFAEQGKNFDRELISVNPDGSATYKWTAKPERVFDGENWVDRQIQNNGTHFNIYSNHGSFTFDKTDCTITQYVAGFDPIHQTAHDSDIVIGDWFWTIARKNGSAAWQVIDPMIFACSINTFQNSTGKYMEMTRMHPSTGSYLKVTLAAPKDGPIEDFNEFYMNVPGWSGNKFAFVLWAKDVKTGALTYRNGSTIPIHNGATIIDRANLTVNSMDFIKDGNAFFFDWKKAQSQFKTLLINKTGETTDIQFGFNNNASTMTTGQKIYLDPTYGYTSSGATNRAYYYTGTTGTNYQNSVSGTATLDATQNLNVDLQATGAANTILTIPRWDISTIPAGSVADTATVRYDVGTVANMGARTCAIFEITHDPATNTPTTMYYDGANVNGSESVYVRGDTTCQTAALDKTISLGTNATSYITSTSIARGWFAASMIIEGVRDGSAHTVDTLSGAGLMELEIVYHLPPKTFSLKPMMSDNSTAIGGGYVYQRNTTGNFITVINASDYARMTGTSVSLAYNYTVKNMLDNFVVNKTFNKQITDNLNKQGPTNIYPISCGVGTDFIELMNFTNHHNSSTVTAPVCASNDDVSYVIRFIKLGTGPSSNSTTKLIHRVSDTVTYGYSPSKVLVNGSSKSFTFTNNVLNATGIQVANGYTSVRLSVQIITDNVTSRPTGLVLTQVNPTRIDLSWTAPTETHGDAVNGYRIWRNGAILVANTTTTGTTYSDTTAVTGNAYKYMICAWNRIGCSPYSGSATNAPNAVTDLTTTYILDTELGLDWSQPSLNGGTLTGYQINYTTPWGNPQTKIVNSTNSTTSLYTVTGLTEGTPYSFRIGVWTNQARNATGNILNVTTLEFNTANFTIGFISLNSSNDVRPDIRFTRSEVNSTDTLLTITYDDSFYLDCNLMYQFAQTNQTYDNITSTLVSGDKVSSFQFRNAGNEVIHVDCWDEATNTTGRYVLTQSDFLLLQQIENFRNGTYGTEGMFGVIDLVTLIAIIISMIGLNRVNETVGAIFTVMIIGSLGYFGIIDFPVIIFSIFALIMMLVVTTTRKD